MIEIVKSNAEEIHNWKDEIEKYHLENNTPKGKMSSLSHIKMATYEWNMEKNWDRENAFVFVAKEKGKILGAGFHTLTKRKPRHATFRHIFTFE